MQTAKKSTTTLKTPSSARAAAGKSAVATPAKPKPRIDWSVGKLTPGGGVAATIATLRGTRGPNKKPTKKQVAIRLDREVLEGFQAAGPGWQTRMNVALREWLASRSTKRKVKALRTV